MVEINQRERKGEGIKGRGSTPGIMM